jgi:hypothetical protein
LQRFLNILKELSREFNTGKIKRRNANKAIYDCVDSCWVRIRLLHAGGKGVQGTW